MSRARPLSVEDMAVREVFFLAGVWAAKGRYDLPEGGTPAVEVGCEKMEILKRFESLFGGEVLRSTWRLDGTDRVAAFLGAVLPHIHLSRAADAGRARAVA